MVLDLRVPIYRIVNVVFILFFIRDLMRNVRMWIGANVGRIGFDWSRYSPFGVSRTYLHFEL